MIARTAFLLAVAAIAVLVPGRLAATRAVPPVQAHPLSDVHVSGGRALVVLPFAHQIGPNGGYQEILDLQNAGFQVDVLRDADASVHNLKSMGQYNVIYIMSHGGVNPYGEANLVTGQLVDDDPEALPLFDNFSLSKATVADEGDTQYWAMLSNFIRYYVGQFSPNALVYVDTCGLLRASYWWQALYSKGVGVLVTWDQDSQFRDNIVTSARFFDDLLQGDTVDQALHDVKAAGLGKSVDITQPTPVPAHLGYIGHGGITLENAVTGTAPHDPPTPTPAPTATSTAAPTPTPTPTAPPTPTPRPSPDPTLVATSTATATATPTPKPLPLALHMQPALAPGQRQIITVSTAPGSIVNVRVDFPNGEHQSATRTADASGSAIYRYHQRASLTTHDRFTADVLVTAVNGDRSAQALSQYHILLGSIDLSVEPRDSPPGGRITIWVHTAPYTPVTLVVRMPNGHEVHFRATTGSHGWAHHSYQVADGSADRGIVQVLATAVRSGRTLTTNTTFTVK